MATTIGRITEQIQRLINSGEMRDDKKFESEEVRLLVNQVLNRLLRAERIQMSVPEGQYLPENAAMFCHEIPLAGNNTAFDTKGGRYFVKLPQQPMALPMGLGIYRVAIESPGATVDYIPWDDMVSSVAGTPLNSYTVHGDELRIPVFPATYFDQTSVLSLKIWMVGVDLDRLGDWDIIPVSSDMEDTCIREVLTLLGVAQATGDTANDGSSQR